MKLILFDEAFKLSADDICRGDGAMKQSTLQLQLFPMLGFTTITVKENVKSIDDILNKQSQIFSHKYFQETVPVPIEEATNEEFDHVRTLISGTFGYVSIVRRIITNIYYCRKSLSKRYLIQTNKVHDAKKEKKILESLRFPFTIHLKHFYHDSTSIHFVLPLLVGGDLFGFLKRYGRLHERLAKFISSQILLAVEFLHVIGLIHRDLKVENILIDHEGYIKLTGFNLSKLIKYGRTYSICGTAEYMAPEVISYKGYGLAADWWSFGVIIYELCNGLTPFFADETVQVFTLITHCDYAMPVHFSTILSDLITKLLQPDLSKRLGNLQKGVDDIKQHYWFRDVPWLYVINRKILSPMIPYNTENELVKYLARGPEPNIKFVKEDGLLSEEFANF